MKTLKISDGVHFELKRFSADHPEEKMEVVGGFAIMQYLKDRGHKFMAPFNPKLLPLKNKKRNK